MAKDKDRINRHIVQWKHNRLLISQIPSSHPDWIVTVVFYTAVQAIDAALAFEDVSAWNHETRFAAIAGINRFTSLKNHYHPLYDLCRKVRYTADPNQWIPPEKIDKYVIRGHLLPLEKSVEGLMGQELNLPTIDLHNLSAPTAKS